MVGGPWVLALLWTCLAGCLCGGVEDSFGETRDDIDYKFNTNYIAMKKAASGVNTPNPDVLVVYGIEAASLLYAVTHKFSNIWHQHLAKNSSKIYLAVVNGQCLPPPSRSHAECLTEREARMVMLKEVKMALHIAAGMVIEAGVRTRLQWFKENGVDDIVLITSANVQNLVSDLILSLYGPVKNLWKRISKLKNILEERYTSGMGNADKMVSAADALSSEVYAIIGAIASKQYPVYKFLFTTKERVHQYSAMFQDHLESVTSMPQSEMYKDSPHPFINRYWDARALEYAITWLFRIRKEANMSDAKEFDNALKHLYTKLVAGETEEALEFTVHALSKAMDRLGHRILGKYLEQPMQIEIGRLPMQLPINLEDLNPLGVPKSLFEDTSPLESFLNFYLERMEEESASKVMFEHLVTLL